MRKLLALLVIVLPGCPLLDADVAVDDICVTQTGIQIPGSGVDGPVDVDQDFTFDLSALKNLPMVGGTMKFTSATITTTADLTQIASANLSIASGDPNSTLPTLDAYDCAGDCIVDGSSLDLTSTAKDNVLAYLGPSLAGSIRLSGHLPNAAWTMDVVVCMNANLSQSVSP